MIVIAVILLLMIVVGLLDSVMNDGVSSDAEKILIPEHRFK